MNLIMCDGCRLPLGARETVLEGRRANGLVGGGLPEGDFHLCLSCSTVAFHAIVTRKGVVNVNGLASEIVDAMQVRSSTDRSAAGARGAMWAGEA